VTCGGGAGEREGERGDRCGMEQRDNVASSWQRPGRGAHGRRVAARQWRAVGRRDADGVADRWAGA
jgi:hypothetical protein